MIGQPNTINWRSHLELHYMIATQKAADVVGEIFLYTVKALILPDAPTHAIILLWAINRI